MPAGRSLGWLMGVGVFAHSLGALATPVDALGLGARAKGLGGAATADTRDYSANYYNPSALAFFEGMRLSAGFSVAEFSLSRNSRRSEVEPLRAFSFGVAAPGQIAGVPVAFGMAMQLPNGHISKTETIREGDPYWVFYQGRMQLLYTSLNLAVRPLAGWSLGVGTASLATTRGGFQVRGVAVVPQFERSEYESDLRHELDADLLSVRYPQYSTTFRPSKHTRFGVAYREQAKLDTDVGARLIADIDGSVLIIPVRYEVMVDSVKMFIPRQLAFGAAWTPEHWSLEVDLTWYDWSRYRSPISATTTYVEADTPDGVTLDLPESAPQAGNRVAFVDRVVPRFGVEYRWPVTPRLTVPVRAGYAFEPSPVPPQTATSNLLDSNRHLVAGGVGVALAGLQPVVSGAVRIDVSMQYGSLERREHVKRADATRLTQDGSLWSLSGDLSLEFE